MYKMFNVNLKKLNKNFVKLLFEEIN